MTEWFSLTLGGRHDINTQFGSTNNPRISGVFKITKDLTLKILAGTGFSAPSGWEMFSQTSTRKANESLRPERLRSYEVGLGYRFLKKYYVSGNVNYNQISGLLLEVQTTEAIPGQTNRFWTQNQNAVDAKILGSEISTEIQVLKNLSINANYSYSKGLFVNPSPLITSSPSTEGRPGDDLALDFRNAILRRKDVPKEGAIPNYPTHKVNFGTTFYFTENVSLYTGANYVDIRRTVSTNLANKVVPAYVFIRIIGKILYIKECFLIF
jgi:outer membrane receptor protein involved in Fe transport